VTEFHVETKLFVVVQLPDDATDVGSDEEVALPQEVGIGQGAGHTEQAPRCGSHLLWVLLCALRS
jgi:hypothetical protein